MRYIDAETAINKLEETICARCVGQGNIGLAAAQCQKDCEVYKIIAECPTLDVVSRDQYNLLYDECLRLRTLNEQLMDSLREKEDDGK